MPSKPRLRAAAIFASLFLIIHPLVDASILPRFQQAPERDTNKRKIYPNRPGAGPPDVQSLAPYLGTFGEREARILFDRFGFGASPERIDEAVRDGLALTITKLTTWQPENGSGAYKFNLDAIEQDLACDAFLRGNTGDNPNKCNPNDPFDFTRQFYSISKMVKFTHSPNQFFYKLLFFLHDERMSASDLLGDDFFYRHIYPEHWNMLLNGARSGDYTQFMRSYLGDTLGHIIWLDGEDNFADNPNTNFAREFWELGTVGTTDLDGKPVYGSPDIAQAALVHTGWRRVRKEDRIGPYEIAEYHPEDHAKGSFMIFQGTPWQATVSEQEDLLQATFRHPRTAEHLAEDLWKEYLNPFADARAIRELAQIIRSSNYNLHPAMRVMMGSKALFAEGSRETLIKQPIDLVIGFLRSFPGFTPDDILKRAVSRDDYQAIYAYTETLGQAFLSPPTVFGWDEKTLASSSYLKRWRDVVNQLVHKQVGSNSNIFEFYDLDAKFMNGLSNTDQLIDRASSWFNVPLSTQQRDFIKNYLDNRPFLCTPSTQAEPGCSAGGKLFFRSSPIFNNPPDREERIKGLIAIIINQPSYRTK